MMWNRRPGTCTDPVRPQAVFVVITAFFFLLSMSAPFRAATHAGGSDVGASTPASPKIKLVEAVTCERIEDARPVNRTVLFSTELGEVCCFTAFDPVPEKTSIYHEWFYRDKTVTKIRLQLHPPRWASYSRIRLRNADKGPWRVEITDQSGNLLETIRFSITD